MKAILALIIFAIIEACGCVNIKELFEDVNKKTEDFNAIAAEIAWESSVNPANPNLQFISAQYQKERITWQHQVCDQLTILHNRHLLNNTQSRQTYLMCRGPKYTYKEARLTSELSEKLLTIYTEVELCIPTDKEISSKKFAQVEDAILKQLKTVNYLLKTKRINANSIDFAEKEKTNEGTEGNKVCLKGEDDFNDMMAFSRNNDVLHWLWVVWRDKVGSPLKEPYRKLIDVENVAARRNGYSDIGASWRDEQEISNLRQVCRRLYDNIRPLYKLLHGVVRFYLRRQYGDIVPLRGPIPAHLLGNLWSQNWESLADLILPKKINFDENINKLNWTVEHMVNRAEDFYQSLGLPPMTAKFWKKSVFKRNNDRTRCHGAAADMYNKIDFRLIYCSGTKMADFYVLHHELGHIQYFMAYENQPALFRQANTAFQETIGDTIMLGVMTPQHLHRLGLINDSLLYGTGQEINLIDQFNEENKNDKANFSPMDTEYYTDKINDILTRVIGGKHDSNKDNFHITTDDILILKLALNKIPQIPFSLLIDEYRWKYFEGDFTNLDENTAFWQMALELQGIAPPTRRGWDLFDIGAKFHVPDNTPYVRYFLSSFLQHQLFESLCKAAVFGRRDAKGHLPDSIAIHRCDIYGSKSAGKLLKNFMSRGHSQHWQQILQETTGQHDLSAAPLERYYRPLYKLLTKLVRLHRIPIGW